MEPNDTRQSFREQIEYFRGKVPTPSGSPSYDDRAFTVAGITRADYISYLFETIARRIEGGGDYDRLVADMKRDDVGKELSRQFSDRHLRTVFDTNFRRSHAAGRLRQMDAPETIRVFPYRQWIHRDSPEPRKSHIALHRKVFPSDSEFWKRAFPPCAFGCRCGVRALTAGTVERMGLRVEDPPDWREICEPPFTRSAGVDFEGETREIAKNGIDRQPPALRSGLERLLKEGRKSGE